MYRVAAPVLLLTLFAACGRGGPEPDAPAPAVDASGPHAGHAAPASETDDPHAGHLMPSSEARGEGMGRMGRGQGMGRMGRGEGMGRGQGMGEMGGMGRRSLPPLEDPTDPVLLEGKAVFNDVCAQCHTLEPPPHLAPPMRMVSMHLRERFEAEEEAVAHVVAWATTPDPARSVLPAHAIERFGLMAPQALDAEALEKVARYVWWMGQGMEGMEPGGMEPGGMGMGRPGGRGMRHRGGR